MTTLDSMARRTIRPVALAVLVGSLACSGHETAPSAPLAPATSSADRTFDHGLFAADQKATPAACTPHAPVVGSGVFGPSGGTLIVGDTRLIIPGGALRDTVTISGTSLGDGTSTVSFQPEGLHFRQPAMLVFDGMQCQIPADVWPSVVYLGPTGEVLETIEAIYLPRWKVVGAPIVHFSGYAIGL